MKRRLNVLCLLVILVLGYSVFESLYQVGLIMKSSYEMGYQAGIENKDVRAEMEKIENIKPVAVFPDNFPVFSDSILNEKTGEYVPMIYSQMIVSVETQPNIWQMFVLKLTAFANIFAVIFAIFIFIRLIISINKSDIFNWKNVRRLRWLGWSLIFSFIFSVIPMAMTSIILSDAFSLKGYSLHLTEFMSITNLVLGLSGLIVGEVFAIGLRMKEEQDLTI